MHINLWNGRITPMTPEEIRQSIGKSNSYECYEIVCLVNNGALEEASERIRSLFNCDAETALAVSRIFYADLHKEKSD